MVSVSVTLIRGITPQVTHVEDEMQLALNELGLVTQAVQNVTQVITSRLDLQYALMIVQLLGTRT